jgi:hypothetical protein
MIGAVAFSQVAPMAAFSPIVAQAATPTRTGNVGTLTVDSAGKSPVTNTFSPIYINGGKINKTTNTSTAVVYTSLKAQKSKKEKLIVAVTKTTCTEDKVKVNGSKLDCSGTETKAAKATLKDTKITIKAGKPETGVNAVRVWVAKINTKDKELVSSGSIIDRADTLQYADIAIGTAPKKVEVVNRYGEKIKGAPFVASGGIQVVYLKGVNGDTVLNGADLTYETEEKSYKKAKDYAVVVTGSALEDAVTADKNAALETGKTLATDLAKYYPVGIKGINVKKSKATKAKITWFCEQNGKKASASVTVTNPVAQEDLTVAAVDTGSNVVSQSADKKTCTITSNTDASTKKGEEKFTIDPNFTGYTDKLQVKAVGGTVLDTDFSIDEKGKLKGLSKSESKIKPSIKGKNGVYELTIKIPKGTSKDKMYFVLAANKNAYTVVTYQMSK